MGDVILYIAASVDGYIADKEGHVSWLEEFNQGDEDYGYAEFYDTVGSVIMGGTTYRQVLGFGEWPYQGVTSYIVTTQEIGKASTSSVVTFSGRVSRLVEQIRRSSDRHIWLVGGANLLAQFINQNLIDAYIITIVPILLGGGIALFQDIRCVRRLNLERSTSFPSGVIQVAYRSIGRAAD